MEIRKTTLTVLIPAYNEGKNLEKAVINVVKAVKGKFRNHEIIILNANSIDNTGDIADRLAKKNKKIKVIHRKRYFGLGENYMAAVKQAKMEYFTMFPGDNENSILYFEKALMETGKAGIIVPYTINKEVRSFLRRIISNSYILFLNIVFGMKLKYYNGNAIYKTKTLKKLNLISKDFAYNSEILIKLIKAGNSYKEFGIKINPTKKTAIFKIRNIVSILKTVAKLFYEVRLRK